MIPPVLFILALGFIALGSTLFVVVYHGLMRWWETAVGQNIMLLMGALAAITDLALVNALIGRPDWMRWVFFGLYLAIGAAIWWRLALLIQAYRDQSPPVDEPAQRNH
jgi:hypothetical protein